MRNKENKIKWMLKCFGILALFITQWAPESVGQQATIEGEGTVFWDYKNNYAEIKGGKSFTTYVATGGDESNIKKMVQMDMGNLFYIADRKREGGIMADLSVDGKVILEVFSYNPNTEGNIGEPIYQIELTEPSTNFTYKPLRTLFKRAYQFNIESDNIFEMMKVSKLYYWETCKQAIEASPYYEDFIQYQNDIEWELPFVKYLKSWLGYSVNDGIDDCAKTMGMQPVVIKLTVEGDAIVKRVKIPGIGEKDMAVLFGKPLAPKTINFAGLTDPTPDITEKIAYYPDLGGIQINKYYWGPMDNLNLIDYSVETPVEPEKYLEGQGITIAKMDMQSPDLYRGLYNLKFTYKFVDPRNGEDLIPEACIQVDKPLGGQFDVLSHAAARNGAVFGMNGTFYDYFYRCIPAIRQYIKIDDEVMSYPNVLSHKLKGAFAFDFTKTPPVQFQEISVTTPSVEDLGSAVNRLVVQNLENYPNIMSGGHYSYIKKNEDGSFATKPDGSLDKVVYAYTVPEECTIDPDNPNDQYPWPNIPNSQNGKMYPWEGDVPSEVWPTLKWITDKGNREGWAYLACPADKFGGGPGYDGKYNELFGCSKLDPATQNYVEYRKLYNCVDSRRAVDEFGGQDRQIRKGRTFVAWKDNQLHFVTVDGIRLYRNRATGAIEAENESSHQIKDDAQRGFTVQELGRFFDQMGFENLVHMDGGTSTEFFVNGRGMLHKTIDTFATLDGPLRQRYTSAFILVVPEFHLDEIGGLGFNHQYLELDNTHSIERNKSVLSLTPSLAQLKEKGQHGGLLTASFKMEDTHDQNGSIIFSMSEDTYGHAKDIHLVGVGKMPNQLVDSLYKYQSNNLAQTARFRKEIQRNNQSFYTITVQNDRVVSWSFADPGQYDKYLDGAWHNFAHYRHKNSTNLVIDGQTHHVEEDTEYAFFSQPNTTHAMMGSVMLNGAYITNASKINLDNVGFITNDQMIEELEISTNKPLINTLEEFTTQAASTGDPYPFCGWNNDSGAYLLQLEERNGMHAFATDLNGQNKFWGLQLNTERRRNDNNYIETVSQNEEHMNLALSFK